MHRFNPIPSIASDLQERICEKLQQQQNILNSESEENELWLPQTWETSASEFEAHAMPKWND